MTLKHRILRRLGHDTVREYRREIRKTTYTVTHLDGTESKVVAHGYDIEGSFAKFYKWENPYIKWIDTAIGPIWDLDKVELRVLEGIREIEETNSETTAFTVAKDMADGRNVDYWVSNQV